MHNGERIRQLLEGSTQEATIISPFIKAEALRSLLTVLPTETHVRCVTRWRAKEIAAGVSDVEVLDVLDERGNARLTLVDRLHAKLYVAGDRCLVGSANVTLAGFGEASDGGNIEILVEKNSNDADIVGVLEEIDQLERVATRSMADVFRRWADGIEGQLPAQESPHGWFPCSRRPELAYRLYTHPPRGYTKVADKMVLQDLVRSNLPLGLDEVEFRAGIRSLLEEIELSEPLLGVAHDVTLTRADAQQYLESLAGNEITVNDLWNAFVEWMTYFFPEQLMKQEISEVGLRRAVSMSHE